MKILMVAVFSRKSTNNSQSEAFGRIGCEVIEYDYRDREAQLKSRVARDGEIVRLCQSERPDLVFFSKCNGVSDWVVTECNKVSKTCLWYMDPMNGNYARGPAGVVNKIKLCTFSCFAARDPFNYSKSFSNDVYFVREGFDESKNFYIPNVDKVHDVSFIGNLRASRFGFYEKINFQVINNAFGEDHSRAVCMSKINLNFTDDGASGGTSDRSYKVLASRGFLLTQAWPGLDCDFVDGKDLIVFSDIDDLKGKIEYYLENESIRNEIAGHGYEMVQKFTRTAFAKNILDIMKAYD
jgi:hypothetical protein